MDRPLKGRQGISSTGEKELSSRTGESINDPDGFYSYIFDGLIPEDYGGTQHKLFEGSVTAVSQRIDEYRAAHPDTKAQTLVVLSGSVAPMPWLSGIDPENNFFIVVDPSEEG